MLFRSFQLLCRLYEPETDHLLFDELLLVFYESHGVRKCHVL